ncbi:MAG: DUF362 domain-containing protein, partial [Ruminiclostridium sp.]|nr:DUF362 domain-containing protein [Ruminiclostridium sp.]
MKKFCKPIALFTTLVFLLTGCSSNTTTPNRPSNTGSSASSSKPQNTDSQNSQKPFDSQGGTTGSESGENDTTDSESTTPSEPSGSGNPVVYFTSDITPESLMAVYEKIGWTPGGNVAVKLSTGEPPASNYLQPSLIKDLVQSVNGTIVECNTAYGGSRAETAMHYQVAKDHGFTDIADFKILDEDGSMTLTVNGGTVLSENYVGDAFDDYDSYLVLSHFKGHSMAGFGGAIKNISIGLGSSMGKAWLHSGGTSTT